MQIIACMVAYNEAWIIERSVAALREHGIDRLIVVDGAWQGFPHAAWSSTDGTLEYLRASVAQHPDWLTLIESPLAGWPGQEVKRTAYLRAVDGCARPGDWLYRVDADEIVIANVCDQRGRTVRDFLAEQAENAICAFVPQMDVGPSGPRGGWNELGDLYRWSPGMYYGREHWHLHDAQERIVWSEASRMGAGTYWHHLQKHHHSELRARERLGAKSAYEQYRNDFRRLHGCMNPNPVEVTHG